MEGRYDDGVEVGVGSDPTVGVEDAIVPVFELVSVADADTVEDAVLVSVTEGLALTGRSG